MKFSLALNTLVVLALGVSILAAPLTSSEIQEKSDAGLRLLSLDENAAPVWKSEDEKLELMRQGVHFFDVTEVYELEQSAPKRKAVAVTCEFLLTRRVLLFLT